MKATHIADGREIPRQRSALLAGYKTPSKSKKLAILRKKREFSLAELMEHSKRAEVRTLNDLHEADSKSLKQRAGGISRMRNHR